MVLSVKKFIKLGGNIKNNLKLVKIGIDEICKEYIKNDEIVLKIVEVIWKHVENIFKIAFESF